MKVRVNIFFFAINLLAVLLMADTAGAQQYKLRQSTSMMGMKSESTIYVKAMRKRTEGGGYMGMNNLTTIEQCDLQRSIRINDKKKVYLIDPFSKEAEEVAGEDAKPGTKTTTPIVASSVPSKDKIGGVITLWYNIVDTGERKKMYGFTARHIWTTQKIKPSADACTMKDSMIIKTDGWYIDLPQFNCPVQFVPANVNRAAAKNQPQCMDRYVSKRSGKGKLGFPLLETKTMIMGNGSATTSEFETSVETLEFSTAKLDSMLFEIPLGYKQVFSEEELQDKVGVNEMMLQSGSIKKERSNETVGPGENKNPGRIRIGVYEPKGDDGLEVSALQQHLVNTLSNGNVEAIAIASKDEAQKYKCDLLLTTDFKRVKQGSKVGGLLKAIKNTDPFAVSSYNIDAEMTLANLSDGSTRLQQKVNGKYEGKLGGAAKLAIEEGCSELLKELN
jgi:hypothetical protein